MKFLIFKQSPLYKVFKYSIVFYFQTNERNNPHQREPMMVPTNAVRDAVNQFAANQDR